MLTADTGSDEPKIHVSRKSITETTDWGREKNKSPVIKYLSNNCTLTNQGHIFSASFKKYSFWFGWQNWIMFSIRCSWCLRRTRVPKLLVCALEKAQSSTHTLSLKNTWAGLMQIYMCNNKCRIYFSSNTCFLLFTCYKRRLLRAPEWKFWSQLCTLSHQMQQQILFDVNRKKINCTVCWEVHVAVFQILWKPTRPFVEGFSPFLFTSTKQLFQTLPSQWNGWKPCGVSPAWSEQESPHLFLIVYKVGVCAWCSRLDSSD